MSFIKNTGSSLTKMICDYADSRFEPPSMAEIQEFMVKKKKHPREKTKDLVKYCVKQGHLVSVSSEDGSGVNRFMPKADFDKIKGGLIKQTQPTAEPDQPEQVLEMAQPETPTEELEPLLEKPAAPENLAVIYPETTFNVMYNGKTINNMTPGQPWNGITELISFSEDRKEPFKILFQNWAKHNGKIIAANDAAIEFLGLKNVGRL
jgi:hypothetical protein